MKKSSALLAALLLSLAGTAVAYDGFQNMQIYYSNTPWFRGTANTWGKTALVAASAYKYSGITYAAYINVPAGTQSFKIDTSTAADWSTNYGDNWLGDACLDIGGGNIPLTQGAGTYEIRFNTGVSGYGCGRAYYSAAKLDSFTAVQRSMYLRTSFNNWLNLPMYLVRNNVWEAPIFASPNVTGQMKFDVRGDWSSNYGRPYGSDPRAYLNAGTASTGGDNISIYFEDYSGEPTVTRTIRFNDQSREYAVCPNASKAICQ